MRITKKDNDSRLEGLKIVVYEETFRREFVPQSSDSWKDFERMEIFS